MAVSVIYVGERKEDGNPPIQKNVPSGDDHQRRGIPMTKSTV
jgi:hypothetical protein